MSKLLLALLLLLAGFVFVAVESSEGFLPLYLAEHYHGHYHGDHPVREDVLPSYPNFIPAKETWCRGGRGRIIGGYQSEPIACASICAEEVTCGGFNLRAVDGICAAYTHGCREDSNPEWTYYRRVVSTKQASDSQIDAKSAEATTVSHGTTNAQAEEATATHAATEAVTEHAEPETTTMTPVEEATTTTTEATTSTTTTTTEEPTTTEEATTTTVTTTTTTEAATTTTTEPTTTEELTTTITTTMAAVVEEAIEVKAVKASKFEANEVNSQGTSNDDNKKPIEQALVVPATKTAVYNEYEAFVGNCRGGEILKMFVQISPRQCADACSAHCSCVGFTYADDTEHCVLKETRCEKPIAYHPNVNFYAHIYRHPAASIAQADL